MPTEPDWLETKCERMIGRARQSQFARDIFADAARLVADHDYQPDVALIISLRYWEGNPSTGRVSGVDP